MKFIAILLTAAIFVRHDSAKWLAGFIGTTHQAVFYVLGGFLEAILCFAVILLLIVHKKNPYMHLAVLACLIGISEGMQIAVCRMLQSPIPGKNLCDAYTNLPIGALLTSLYAVSISYLWRPTKMLNLITVVASAEVAYLTNFYVGILLLSVCFAMGRVRHGRQP